VLVCQDAQEVAAPVRDALFCEEIAQLHWTWHAQWMEAVSRQRGTPVESWREALRIHELRPWVSTQADVCSRDGLERELPSPHSVAPRRGNGDSRERLADWHEAQAVVFAEQQECLRQVGALACLRCPERQRRRQSACRRAIWAAQATDGEAEQFCLEEGGQTIPVRIAEEKTGTIWQRSLPEERVQELFNPIGCPSYDSTTPGNIANSTRDNLFGKGEEFPPYPVSAEAAVAVAFILTPL